ncbi:MAG: hypothetical protein AAGG55_16965 [Pseudomonadota bacterium]
MNSTVRQGLVTWMVVYPTITTLLTILEPLLVGLAMPLRTLIVSGLMVTIMVGWAMPIANRKFAQFIDVGFLR